MADETMKAEISTVLSVDGSKVLYPRTVKAAILDWDESGGGGVYTLPVASPSVLGGVQPVKKTDAMTQSVGVDAKGTLWTAPEQSASGGKSKRTCRFVIGTSTAGWTEDDCDYLCDGVDDHVEILAAAADATTLKNTYTGGDETIPFGCEAVLLNGVYNISRSIGLSCFSVFRGNGGSEISIGDYPIGGGTVIRWVGDYSTSDKVSTVSPDHSAMIYGGYCHISNLVFDMGKSDAALDNKCIKAEPGISIDHCSFCRCPTGIAESSGTGVTSLKISHCMFSECTYGIYSHGRLICTDNGFCGDVRVFISSAAHDTIVISGNIFESRTPGAITIKENSYSCGVLIANNILLNSTIIDGSKASYEATVVNNITG